MLGIIETSHIIVVFIPEGGGNLDIPVGYTFEVAVLSLERDMGQVFELYDNG
jgi:hypothetical protein